MLVDSYGVDAPDAYHRASAALRIPAGMFRGETDLVGGPGQRWMCTAEVASWADVTSDREFVAALIEAGLVDTDLLIQRVDQLPHTVAIQVRDAARGIVKRLRRGASPG
jgi:hypothetical protein